jgi:hypothetical protein
MTIHAFWPRIATVVAVATAALFLGASTATAVTAGPAPTAPAVSAQACPDINALAQSLRAAFSAQAVRNYTELTRRDCADGLGHGTCSS